MMVVLMGLTLLCPVIAYDCRVALASGCDRCNSRVPGTYYELECQSKGVIINNVDKSVNIRCIFRPVVTFYYANMTNLQIGNVQKLEIEHCTLADTSLKRAMENSGIYQFKELRVIQPFKFEGQAIGKKTFEDLFEVTTLVLSFPPTLTENVFEGMKNLTRLEIRGYSSEYELPKTLFKPLTKLKNLILRSTVPLVPGMFQNLTELEHLSVEVNYDFINRTVFSGLENLTSLQLTLPDLGHVDSDLLVDMPKLKSLSFFPEKITQFPSTKFLVNLTHLEQFNMAANNLDFSPLPFPSFIENLLQLKTFSLRRCKIRALRNNAFKGSTNISTIELSDNKLEVVPDRTFDDVEAVQLIDLSDNNIHVLPIRLFSKTKRLKSLKLNRNKLGHINGGLFSGLKSLEFLDLSYNQLERIEGNQFSDLTSLKKLHLSQNNLKSLEYSIGQRYSVLQKCINLEELNLKGNLLSMFYEDWRVNLIKLKILNLSHNRLIKIEDLRLKHRDLFPNLSSLESLDLSHNNLDQVDSHLFLNLMNLKTLDMSYNKLTSLEYEFDKRYSVLKNCNKLENLHIRNNFLTMIYEDWRVNLTKLKRLDLAFNHLVAIDIHSLNFTSGVTIDISDNKIKTVDFSQYSFFDVEENNLSDEEQSIQTKKLIMDDNPLVCNCTLLDFILFVKGNRSELNKHFNIEQFETNGLSCHKPENLGNVNLKFLNLAKLECFTCPKQCNCDFSPSQRAYNIDCKIVNFKHAPEPVTSFEYGSDHAELRLEGYQVHSFTLPQSAGYGNVTHFYLANNSINSINFTGFSPQLKVLDLSDNLLTSLTMEAVTFLRAAQHLTHLSLHNNQWQCNCESVALVSLVNDLNTKGKVLHPDSIKCADSGTPLVNMTESELCPISIIPSKITWEVTVTFSAATVIIVVLAASVFYYKYKREIQIYFYSSRWRFVRWMVTHPDLDENKIYDAFVSYANEDEEFVTQHLIPELEESGEPKFKLCIHFRDWIAGEMIQTQIINSVLSSRRTIVVLSPNFLRSVWGPMEFKTAHAEALKEGIAKVIVVLYEEVGDEDKLDEELKTYLQMNTFVTWGSPWFWEQLKYALPHPPKKTDSNFKLTFGCLSTKNKGRNNCNKMDSVQMKGGELLYVPESANRTKEPDFDVNYVTVHRSASTDSVTEDPKTISPKENEHGFGEKSATTQETTSDSVALDPNQYYSLPNNHRKKEN